MRVTRMYRAATRRVHAKGHQRYADGDRKRSLSHAQPQSDRVGAARHIWAPRQAQGAFARALAHRPIEIVRR